MSTKASFWINIIVIFYSFHKSVLVLAKPRCSTPADWLDSAASAQFPLQNETNIEGKYVHRQVKATKWPGGIVKFKLHSSLDEADRKQVMLAIDEFHRKTCLKFEEWTEGEANFVSIERDDNICGVAKVCMQLGTEDGYQFAKFGGDCRNKATMVHELGHTICLGHEHERPDRDEYLSFEDCPASEVPRKSSRSVRYGIYDFDSQMHYKCGDCGGGYPKPPYSGFGCGEQVSSGLSLMDAETINQLYECQECRRHRWIPIENLKETDIKNLSNFGVNGVDERPLYICRAEIKGQVLSGMFIIQNRTCLVLSYSFEIYVAQKNVEVLTIVGGPGSQNRKHQYRFVKREELTPNLLSEIGIRAGKFLEVTGPSGDKFARFGFIEFATISRNLVFKQNINNVIISNLNNITNLRRKFVIVTAKKHLLKQKDKGDDKLEQLEKESEELNKKLAEYKEEIHEDFKSFENECIETKIMERKNQEMYSNWLKDQYVSVEDESSVSICLDRFKSQNGWNIKVYQDNKNNHSLDDWRTNIEFQCKMSREFKEILANKIAFPSSSNNYLNLIFTSFERNPCRKEDLFESHNPSIYNYFENNGCQNKILVCS